MYILILWTLQHMQKSIIALINWSQRFIPKLPITCIYDNRKRPKPLSRKAKQTVLHMSLEEKKKNNTTKTTKKTPNFLQLLILSSSELLQNWVLLAIFLKDKPSLCSSPRPTQGICVWIRSCQRFWMCLIQWEFSIHSHEAKFSPQICCCSNKWGVLSCGFPYSDIQT